MLPVVPIGMAELALSCEWPRAFASPLREDVPGILVEVVDCVVEHGTRRGYLEWLEADVFVYHCQFDGLVLAELRLPVFGSHVDGLVLPRGWRLEE